MKTSLLAAAILAGSMSAGPIDIEDDFKPRAAPPEKGQRKSTRRTGRSKYMPHQGAKERIKRLNK